MTICCWGKKVLNMNGRKCLKHLIAWGRWCKKIRRKQNWMKEESLLKLMQLKIIQSFEDEFEISEGHWLVTLAIPGSIWMKCDSKLKLASKRQMKHCSVIGNGETRNEQWCMCIVMSHDMTSKLHYKYIICDKLLFYNKELRINS